MFVVRLISIFLSMFILVLKNEIKLKIIDITHRIKQA